MQKEEDGTYFNLSALLFFFDLHLHFASGTRIHKCSCLNFKRHGVEILFRDEISRIPLIPKQNKSHSNTSAAPHLTSTWLISICGCRMLPQPPDCIFILDLFLLKVLLPFAFITFHINNLNSSVSSLFPRV